MTAAQSNVVDQGGPAPKRNRCDLCHFRNCLVKWTKCNKMGHKAKDFRVRGVAIGVNALPIRAYYECGERNHDQSRCPKLADQRGRNATGRAYSLRDAEQGQGPNVVTGTFLLSIRYARVLFTFGSDKSFVYSGFSHLIDIKPVRLSIIYEVELSYGKLVSMNTVLRVKQNALIVCGKKAVHIPVKGKMLVVKGNYDVLRLKVIINFTFEKRIYQSQPSELGKLNYNRHELRALAQKARSKRVGPGGTVGAGAGSYEPSEKSMMDINAYDYRFM
nr:hypothetical protein [Tanacetum cinerariifolium]